MDVKRTERGWSGHFCCADMCRFRRNTLLEYDGVKIVISTVGAMVSFDKNRFEEIGYKRYYETMAFHANYNDYRYYDADVSKQIYFQSDWSIGIPDADDLANIMHENAVIEIVDQLICGNRYNTD